MKTGTRYGTHLSQLFLLLRTAMLAWFVGPASVDAAVRYVNLNNASPNSPFTNWATAAIKIQDAFDVAMAGDEIIVTNGVYQTGGRAVYGAMTNRVAVTQPITVRSVNGPEVTVISGYQVPGISNGEGAVRCVYLTDCASLVGFTLTNGATRSSGNYPFERNGGGVWCESSSAIISNCVIYGNSATHGGGAYQGTLKDCFLTGNSAEGMGGGALESTLNNCTLTGNGAFDGGGAYQSILNHCTLTNNWVQHHGGGSYGGMLEHCTHSGNRAFWGGDGRRR